MNYGTYRLSKAEWLKYAGMYALLDGAVSMLFYRSWIAFFLFLPGFCWFLGERKKVLAAKRRAKLEKGFLLGMRCITTALYAGYSIENACAQALTDLKKVCEPDEPVVGEFTRIVSGLKINQTMEELLENLAKRSKVEDIQIFAEVFAASRRTGGNLIAVIQSTVSSISEKEETRQEIEVCLAAKKLEQNIMSIIPGLMIFYIGITSPGFLDVMYGNPLGILIMSGCLGVYVFSFLLGRRIVNIEV